MAKIQGGGGKALTTGASGPAKAALSAAARKRALANKATAKKVDSGTAAAKKALAGRAAKTVTKKAAQNKIAKQGGSAAMREREVAAAKAREAVEGRVVNLVSGRGNPGHFIIGSTLKNSTARVKDGKRGDHYDGGDFNHMGKKVSGPVSAGSGAGAKKAAAPAAASSASTGTTGEAAKERVGKWREVDWLGTAGNYGAEGRKKRRAGGTNVDRRTK